MRCASQDRLIASNACSLHVSEAVGGERKRDQASHDSGNTNGFASPVGDSLEGPIDLSETLELRRPDASGSLPSTSGAVWN